MTCPYILSQKAKVAAGHANDPDCKCPPCTDVRIFLSMDRTFFDGADVDDEEEIKAEMRRANDDD